VKTPHEASLNILNVPFTTFSRYVNNPLPTIFHSVMPETWNFGTDMAENAKKLASASCNTTGYEVKLRWVWLQLRL